MMPVSGAWYVCCMNAECRFIAVSFLPCETILFITGTGDAAASGMTGYEFRQQTIAMNFGNKL